MRLKRMHWFGIISGAILLIVNLVYFLLQNDKNLFLFLLGLTATIVALPFIVGVVLESKKEQEMSEMFLEFSRNLAESVSTGTPISKSIVNVRNKNYGSLTPHVQKLTNQISLGIPVGKALDTFAADINSNVIKRAIGLIREAERAGGEIDYILDSVAKSISEVDKLKKERKAAVFSLIVQGYIIFFIFIAIMLVMQFQILPLVGSAGVFGQFTLTDVINLKSKPDIVGKDAFKAEKLAQPFLFLLLTQGLLVGLTIGKLSEGNIRAGIKHSFILIVATFLISTGANLIMG